MQHGRAIVLDANVEEHIWNDMSWLMLRSTIQSDADKIGERARTMLVQERGRRGQQERYASPEIKKHLVQQFTV